MDSRGCLKYCLEYQGNLPNDLRTAHHVVDWIAESARLFAWTDEEKAAINAIEQEAREMILIYELI